MATYLIDYENVNKDGLNGVSKLTKEDRVIIFYSERADRMTFGLHRRLNETKALIEYKKVEVGGHNALDFQLATYLGFLIANDSSEQYCVVSNDRGFEYLTGFWRLPQYDVCLAREIANSPQQEERRHQRRIRRSNADDHAETHASDKDRAIKSASEHTVLYASEKPAERTSEEDVRKDEIYETEKFDAAFRAEEIEEKTNLMLVKNPEHSLTKVGETVTDELNDRAASGNNTAGADSVGKDAAESDVPETESQTEAAENITAVYESVSAKPEEYPEKHETGRFWFRNEGGRNAYAGSIVAENDDIEHIFVLADGDITDVSEEEQNTGAENAGNAAKTEASGAEEVRMHENDCGQQTENNNSAVKNKPAHEQPENTESDVQKKSTHKRGAKSRSGQSAAAKKTRSPEQEKRIKEVRNSITESRVSGDALTDSDYSQIASYIKKYKTKQGVNNALVRRFGNQRAGEIYQMIKPMLKDKKGGNNQK